MLKKLLKRIIDRYIPFILNVIKRLPFLPKQLILFIDVLIVTLSIIIAYYIRYALLDDVAAFDNIVVKLSVCVLTSGFFFFIFNTYSEFVRFATFNNIMRIVQSLFCTFLVFQALLWLLPDVSRLSRYSAAGMIIGFLLSVCSIFFFRMIVRIFYDYAVINGSANKSKTPLLIFGIDAVHIGLAHTLRVDVTFPYTIVGFIAPKPLSDRYQVIKSRVYSPEDVISEAIVKKGIKTVLVRAEDLQSEKRKALFRRFLEHKIEILRMPVIEHPKDIRKIRKINIGDLLGRNPINTDLVSIGKNMKGKTVLVTGAAGSIGSEIVRQLSRFDLKMMLLVDIAETPLHQLALDFNGSALIPPYRTLIADVRNKKRMQRIFEQYKPDYIYHAAAYKHVPMMEEHPCEAILTNVMGTKIIADLSVAHEVECFVMISTDKAVNPSNVMGASKRIAEMYIQCLSAHLKNVNNPFTSQPRFITTRFGNVLGSNGSVIPLFSKQIAEGGPVTVTHPDIFRYFMTIPEACSLVLEAGNLGKGGEVLVFDMGKSVKIKDLAEEMIRLSGLEPYKDIDIVYTGLRPGEKLYEELMYDKEKAETLQNQKIIIGNVQQCDFMKFNVCFERLLKAAVAYDEETIVKIMKKIVPEFISNNSEFEVLDKIS